MREATVGEDGTYRLCGLPEKYEGKPQAQRKDGGTTAEVSVTGWRSARAAQHERCPLSVASASDTTKGAPVRVPREARVTRTNKAGAPVEGARESARWRRVDDTRAAAISARFASAGTQAIAVRHLGYAPRECSRRAVRAHHRA